MVLRHPFNLFFFDQFYFLGILLYLLYGFFLAVSPVMWYGLLLVYLPEYWFSSAFRVLYYIMPTTLFASCVKLIFIYFLSLRVLGFPSSDGPVLDYDVYGNAIHLPRLCIALGLRVPY